MGDEVVEQAPSTVVPEQARAEKAKRLRDRAKGKLTTSGLVKDVTILGVAGVAIKISYVYLMQLGKRPDLLAAMGTKLIIDMLAVVIFGVLLNRAVDIVDGVLQRSADSLDKALNRMANSSERAAASAAQGAIAQREIAVSQQAMAAAQINQTAVMERVAAAGDTTLMQVSTLQNYQVSQSKIMMHELRRNQLYMAALMDKLDVQVPKMDEERKHV